MRSSSEQGTPDAPDTTPVAGGVTSVDRAVDVLLLFSRSVRPSLGVTEIAQELGMPKSGVHRILTTLRARRLVTYDDKTRKYALGQAAIALSQSYITRLDVQSVAADTIHALARAVGETATLAVRRHGSIVHRAQSVPDHELRFEVRIGRASPLHATASGKAFLAFLPEQEAEDYLRRSALEPLTAQTVTDAGELRRQIELSRVRGYASSVGERLPGVASVAATACDHDGYPVAALAVSGPEARIDVDAVAPHVLDAARQLSREMGHVLG
jgi:IclR family acetate operon transcriptional repressor